MLKINSALTLDATRSQWVDLGIHTEACMTQPETCLEGGAISVWMSISGCSSEHIYQGLITSHANTNSTGVTIACLLSPTMW